MDNNQNQLGIFEQLLFALAIVGLLVFGVACLVGAFERSLSGGSMAIAAAITFSSTFIGCVLLSKK